MESQKSRKTQKTFKASKSLLRAQSMKISEQIERILSDKQKSDQIFAIEQRKLNETIEFNKEGASTMNSNMLYSFTEKQQTLKKRMNETQAKYENDIAKLKEENEKI